MLRAPSLAGRSQTGLDLIKNQQDLVFITDFADFLQPLAAKMVVAALTLDRFNNDGADIGPSFGNPTLNFLGRYFLARDDVFLPLRFRQRKIDERTRNARP